MSRTAILLLLVCARVASADDSLAKARRAVDASDYPAARTALGSALAAGTAGPEDLAEIYKLSGVVEGALGDAAAAQKAFEKWLAIDPKAALPAGTSPKITRPFEAAKARKLAPLTLKIETTADPPRVALVVAADPLHLVARARVFVRVDGKPEQRLDASGADKLAIELPRGKRLDLRIHALDARGNALAELGSTDVPIVVTDAGAAGSARPGNARPIYFRWYAWAGAAAVFGVTATYFGFAARSSQNEIDQLNATSSMHDFSAAAAIESRAQTQALLFNVGMGITAAFAIGAAMLYATEPRAEAAVAAVPVAGGGAVVVGGRF